MSEKGEFEMKLPYVFSCRIANKNNENNDIDGRRDLRV